MRLDRALVERGLVRSRNQAGALIAGGKVLVDGTPAGKASQQVTQDTVLRVLEQPPVSRAAHKLVGALDDSRTIVSGSVLDAGASTGGFTSVCLARGAERVYAVDVGHDQLAAELRHDPRVVLHEGLNLRDLTLEHVESSPVDLVVADVSFISLTTILAPMLQVLHPAGVALLMVKPQFEVGRHRVGPGGVVRDPGLQLEAVDGVVDAARELGWRCRWRGRSRLPGSNGNVEFFVRLNR